MGKQAEYVGKTEAQSANRFHYSGVLHSTETDRLSTSSSAAALPPVLHDLRHLPPPSSDRPLIQPKLTIGAVGDRYEQEADRVAQGVVQQIQPPRLTPMPMPLSRLDSPTLKISSIMQRSSPAPVPTVSPALEQGIEQARGQGQPLNPSLRQPMEQAFGTDFRGVRLHTDARSDQFNRSIQAQAFTTQQDIFLRQGAYQPHTLRGKFLIAHELSHTIQQAATPSLPIIQRLVEEDILPFVEDSSTPYTQQQTTFQQKLIAQTPFIDNLAYRDRKYNQIESYLNYYSVNKTDNKKFVDELVKARNLLGQGSPVRLQIENAMQAGGLTLTGKSPQFKLQISRNVLPSVIVTHIEALKDLINAVLSKSATLEKLNKTYEAVNIKKLYTAVDLGTIETIAQGLEDRQALQPWNTSASYLKDSIGNFLKNAAGITSIDDLMNYLIRILGLPTDYITSLDKFKLYAASENETLTALETVYDKQKGLPAAKLLILLDKLKAIETTQRLVQLCQILAKPHFQTSSTDALDQVFKFLEKGSFAELNQLLDTNPDKTVPDLLRMVEKQPISHFLTTKEPTTRKQALGYTFEVMGQQALQTFPEFPQFQQKLTTLIEKIRAEQAQIKQQKELALQTQLNPIKNDKDKEEQRRTIIKQHAMDLQPIGLSLDRLKLHVEFKTLLAFYGLEIDDKGQIVKGKKVIAQLHSGEEAFDSNPILAANPSNGLLRAVYQKRGKAIGKNNQYVKDDKGIYTRRYVYIEKNIHQFRDLIATGSMIGRYPADPSSKTPRPYNEITSELREEVPDLPPGKQFTDAYQLAYVHQELGSGSHQRGVSAAATGKYTVFSNQGVPFKSDDGVSFEVDLARIPLSTQPNQIPEVITHYTTSAVKNIERTIKGYKIDKGTHRRQLDHYQWSVIKNREVFLKEIKPEYISSLTFHKPIAGQSSTETGTFDQTRLQNVGKNVGTDHYLSGFRAGGKKEALKPKPLTSAPQAEKDQYQHYLSGYQDGQSYREGYDLGENNGQIPDKKDYRKTQGFWDGKYGRDKKWEKV